MKTVIITGGTIDMEFALPYYKKERFDHSIAADSGIRFFVRSGIVPDEVLGDFDSADREDLQEFRQDPKIIFHQYKPEKDATDTELALQAAIGCGSDEIHILGGIGSRFDHTLGTVHTLGIALERQIPCYLVDAKNRIRLIQGRTVLKKAGQYGEYVSLLPLGGAANGVTLTGFKYPLKAYTMDPFHSIGISNEIIEDEAVIDLTDGILMVIESRD